MESKKIMFLTGLLVPIALAATGAPVSLAFFDFNDGFQGWTPESSANFEWVVREIAPKGSPNSFSQFDPDDRSSLFTIVPPTRDLRTKSAIVSPEIKIEKESSLSFHVGFSSFYDPLCRLLLEISTDGFKTSSTLWNSKNLSSPSWGWNRVELPLSDFEGETVSFRFAYTYGSSADPQDKGGYLGDFAIDNFVVSYEPGDDREPDPGENPDPAPTARIGMPVSFVSHETGYPLVAPRKQVMFSDLSSGNPTLSTWTFAGICPDPGVNTVIREQSPEVMFPEAGTFDVTLVAQNDFGVSMDRARITADYEGTLSGCMGKETGKTVTIENNGIFPGSNTLGIGAYAQRFGAPASPFRISGVTVSIASCTVTNSVDGMASIGVHVYSDKDSKPGEKLGSGYISATELPSVTSGTPFPLEILLEKPVDVDSSFFIVVDGIPTNTGGSSVALGYSPSETDSAQAMVRMGNEWICPTDVPTLALNINPAFHFYPQVAFSVMEIEESTPTLFELDGKGGVVSCSVFSVLPLQRYDNDASWLTFTCNEAEDYSRTVTITLDSIPEEETSREGRITFGDGFESITLNFVQTNDDASLRLTTDGKAVVVHTVQGTEVYRGESKHCPSLPKGIFIIRDGNSTHKVIR